MLDITPAAVNQFKAFLAENQAEESGIRIFASKGCCGPAYGMDIAEQASAGDQVVERDGLRLFIEPAAGSALAQVVIDYVPNGPAKGFKLRGLPTSGCCG
jgi:iron-sulfur cluster assembly protein